MNRGWAQAMVALVCSKAETMLVAVHTMALLSSKNFRLGASNVEHREDELAPWEEGNLQ
jgi:hypothetical protein